MSVALAGLRVGRLPYLNAWPFRGGWRGEEPRWTEAPPRRLGELAAAGALDAGLLASRDALALTDHFRPLADLGIATRGAVGSVLLLSRIPPPRLGGRRIALTGESRTSRGLLRVLLAERLGAPDAVLVPALAGPEEEPVEGRLLIGDAALAAARRGGWAWLTDLGEAWTKWTDLPFVWARWVVRRDVPEATARALAAALRGSLARPAPLRSAPRPAGLGDDDVRRYLARFAYRLGPDEAAGLHRFHRELRRHDLLRHHS